MTRADLHLVSRTARRTAPTVSSLVTSLLAGLLVACGSGDKAPADSGTVGGSLIIVQPAEPATLFPPSTNSTDALPIVNAIFDKLAEIGPDLSVNGDAGYSPRLASSWTWATDSLSIAFALDPKARWHDGQPLRADDVRFTFAAYTSDTVGSDIKSLLGNIDSVSVRDSLTAVFWFKRRLPQQFFDATYHMYIMPSHLLSGLEMSALTSAPFGRAPVGTGRFRFVTWEPGVRVEVRSDTANARGRAKLDRITWSFTKDFGAATVKLFAGEADFYEAIRPDDIPQVERAEHLRLESVPMLQYGMLAYNLRSRTTKGAPHPIFGDLRVRRALGMAVDREKMVRNTLESMGLVALANAPRVLIPDTVSLKQLRYDTAAARALLDSAGWTLAPGDSVRRKDGIPFAFEIMAPQSSVGRSRYAVLLQEQLRPFGVNVSVRVLDGMAMGELVQSNKFDAWVHIWGMTPGRLGMGQVWSSDGSANMQGYASTTFDALIDSAFTAFNPDRSKVIWTRVFQQLLDDQPGILLYEPRAPVAIHKRIRTTPWRADAWYADLADWTVDPMQRIDRDKRGSRSER